jgi:hypothetical protein
MKRFLLFLSSAVFCGSAALQAGQVYGTLRDGNGKALAGIRVVIVSPAKAPYEGKTGPDGGYQIFVKETGRCEIQAFVDPKTPATANVFSYAEPAKYELEFAGGALKVK